MPKIPPPKRRSLPRRTRRRPAPPGQAAARRRPAPGAAAPAPRAGGPDGGAGHLDAVTAIAEAMGRAPSPEAALEGALAIALQTLHVDAGLIHLLEADGGTLETAATCGLPESIARTAHRLPVAASLAGIVVRTRQALHVADVTADPRIARNVDPGLLRAEGLRSFACVPLWAHDRVLGTLGVCTRHRRRLHPAELKLLEALGHHIGVSLDGARLLREAQAQAARLAALQAVGETITRGRDLQHALSAIADRLHALIPYDACGIFLRQGEVLSAEVWRGGFGRAEPPRLGMGEGITGWVAQTGSPQLINDAGADPRALPLEGTPSRRQALLAAPLRAEDRVLGVVTLARYEDLRPAGGARFDSADLDLLTTFAHQAALAIEKTRLVAETVARAESLAALNERLRGSESLYRQLTEQASDVIYTRDLEGRITFVNPQVEPLLGYRPEELLGQPIESVATPQTQLTAADRVRSLQAGEELPATTVGELVHKDGRAVTVEVNNALLRRDGQVVGVLGIIRDITPRRAMERELQRRQRELEALNEVGRAIGASLELDRALDLILDKARELLGVTYCAVLRLDEATGELYHLRALGLPAGEMGVRFRLGEGLAGLAALERTPVMSTDVLADPRARPTSLILRHGLRSALAIPLAVPDRVFGVLIIFRPEAGGFAEAEVRLASAFADQAAIALVNASLHEQTRRDLAQLTALREAVEAVSSELHRGLLLQKLIMSAVRLLGGDAGSVGLYEPEEGSAADGAAGRIRLAALHNLPAELLGRVFRPGVGVVGRILETGEPLVMTAYADAPDRITFPGAEGLHGVLSVPIRYQGQLMGTFTIGSRDPARRFTERDVETLSVFAKHAGIAIENARLYRECQAYAKGLEERVLERTRDLAAQKAFTDGVVEALPLGLYVVDRDLRVVTCNRAGEDELGVAEGRLRGTSLLDLLPEAKRDAARAALGEIFTRGAVGRSEEEFSEAGQTRTLRMTRAPLRTEGGAVTYAILLIEDITERKRLEHQVLTAEKLAAVGGLAAGVAHELNNPLATIAGCAEGLLDRLRGPDLRGVEAVADFAEYLRIIEEETYRCKEITGALLQFVREPGRAREPMDLNAALEKALTLVSHQPRFRTLTLRQELAPGLPPARVNEGQIRQVFLSLLLNALEATPGEGTLTIRTLALAEADGPKVAVEFEDQGAGIAPEHLPRIFEPFFTTKPAGKGTGLGLAICQGIVTEHGGRIDVRSQVGAGSTFRVVLPAAAGTGVRGPEVGGRGSETGTHGTT